MSRFKICPRCEKICVPKPSGYCLDCVNQLRAEHTKQTKNPDALRRDPIYLVYRQLKHRCSSKKNGTIRFDYRWKHSYKRFKGWLLKRGYQPGKTKLIRIDNKKGFYPANCMIVPKNNNVSFVCSSYDPYDYYPWLGNKKQKAKRQAEKNLI